MPKKPLKSKEKKVEKPRVHQDLQGFDIEINSFGEIRTSYDIDKINAFLNRNVDDKKLRHREDLDELKKRGLDEEERNPDLEDSKG